MAGSQTSKCHQDGLRAPEQPKPQGWARLDSSLSFMGRVVRAPGPTLTTVRMVSKTFSLPSAFSQQLLCVCSTFQAPSPSLVGPLCWRHPTGSGASLPRAPQYRWGSAFLLAQAPTWAFPLPSEWPHPAAAPSEPLSTFSLTPALCWVLLGYLGCPVPPPALPSWGIISAAQFSTVVIHTGFESEGPGVKIRILTLGKSSTLLDLITVSSTISRGKAREPPPQGWCKDDMRDRIREPAADTPPPPAQVLPLLPANSDSPPVSLALQRA